MPQPDTEDQGQLPDAFFGSPSAKPLDWRPYDDPEELDDDEELKVTPEDVIDILGFDPLEDNEDEQ